MLSGERLEGMREGYLGGIRVEFISIGRGERSGHPDAIRSGGGERSSNLVDAISRGRGKRSSHPADDTSTNVAVGIGQGPSLDLYDESVSFLDFDLSMFTHQITKETNQNKYYPEHNPKSMFRVHFEIFRRVRSLDCEKRLVFKSRLLRGRVKN